jgi:RIO kinase 1
MSNPLEPLLEDGIIDEIMGRLKSGKEADIYRVRRGGEVIAAKVYKDRATRSFKSNADYKEGRQVRSSRTKRAIESGSRFGRESEEEEWKSAEADALGKLFAAGLRVPRPVMFYEGILLMELVTDSQGNAAPRLIELTPTPAAAHALYVDLRSQIVGMLCLDLIHGDLSPYNILDGADGATIIDFPQIVSAPHNTRAEYFFRRDFENVREFLAGFDPALREYYGDARKIWSAYAARELTPAFVPTAPAPAFQGRNNRNDNQQRQWQGNGRSDQRHQRPPLQRPNDQRGPAPGRSDNRPQQQWQPRGGFADRPDRGDNRFARPSPNTQDTQDTQVTTSDAEPMHQATRWDRDGARTAPAPVPRPNRAAPAPTERNWRPAPPRPERPTPPGGGAKRRRPRRRG